MVCDRNKTSTKIDIPSFILELRINVLNKTIIDFVSDMGWSNEKYYSKIVNGYIQNGKRKYSSPTINYIFMGIHKAINSCDDWKSKKVLIEKLIMKYFFIWNDNSN